MWKKLFIYLIYTMEKGKYFVLKLLDLMDKISQVVSVKLALQIKKKT